MKLSRFVVPALLLGCAVFSSSARAQFMPVAERAAPFSVTAMLTSSVNPELTLVQFANGMTWWLPTDKAGTIASVGNPEAIVNVSWKSGGADIHLEIRQQAGESEAKFAARAAETTKEMKKVFPPDPPPSSLLWPAEDVAPAQLVPVTRFHFNAVA